MPAEEVRSIIPSWVASALLVLASIVAVSTIVMQAQQTRELRRSIGSSVAVGVRAGDTLPDLGLTELAGEAVSLHELGAGEPIVVGLMTTTCRFCEANLPNWWKLRDTLERTGVGFGVISLDGAPNAARYRDTHALHWPIWIPEEEGRGLLPPLAVPTTLVLGPEGKVLAAEEGVLNREQLATIGNRAMRVGQRPDESTR